jgi:hypothetical protein
MIVFCDVVYFNYGVPKMRNVLFSVPRFSDEVAEKLRDEFLECEKNIERVVNHHIRRYGGDYHSLYARAVDKLILAFHRYDPSRSEWSKYRANQIALGLKDEMLDTYRRTSRMHTNVDEVALEVPVFCDFSDVSVVADDLTPDALYVLRYIMDKSEAKTFKGHIRNVNRQTRRIGWSIRRTKTAFSELSCMLEL